ncbi:MAG TPA: PmeII family type II restriction endonuclease [Pyrinomonadaceae bacterium]|nr:PmeII family type II restriction endonuclease [Pyrinomonadaceae bacterium]
MKPLNLDEVREYVNENIVDFHQRKIKSLEELRLEKLLTKNPYLFRAKNITTAGELITNLLEAFLSSSEEKLFGDFLEGLAAFIAQKTCNGHKSTAPGVDLEFFNKKVHYVVSVKSGPNWGNSSQQTKLEQDLKNAVARVKQLKRGTNVQPVLGICYGKTRTSYIRGYLKVVGQNFWYLISENKHLYTDIIEPIGHRAKEHNENFIHERSRVVNLFTKQFVDRFCDATGVIDWARLVEFNSGNYDLDDFLP